MAAHSSILAWRISWTEEPGGLLKESETTEVTQHTDKLSIMPFFPIRISQTTLMFSVQHKLGKQQRSYFLLQKACKFSSVQLFSHVQLFATPQTAAHQASLSITSSRSLLKLMSIESVMPSNHLILCCPLLLLPSIFPSIGSFPRSQFSASGSQSIGVSASASVLPMNIQD